MRAPRMHRRQFLKAGATAAAGMTLWGGAVTSRTISPNEKLNLGVIGVANRAAANLQGVSSENIVAVCDVDDLYLDKAIQQYPNAKRFNNFKELLELKDLDAVVVSTPDHTHAVATAAALRRGLHVYCEKPMTHTISECIAIRELARKNKCVTQLGTQIHAEDNYRRVVELVQTGAIGEISEVHVWVGGGMGNQEVPTDRPPVPPNLHYELWLGPVEYRPYHPEYVPFHWRKWWAFGGGTLADLGCHHIDLSHWALDLGYPETVEAEGPPVHPESTPHWLVVRYQYPARFGKPPVKLTWYHGGKRPRHFEEGLLPKWGDGTLFVGSKGMLLAGYSNHVLLPEKDFKDFKRPAPYIPKSLGHHAEWIHACKTKGPTTCNFDYSGILTQTVLLGNVAFRTGRKLEWDAKNYKVANCPEAERFIRHHYRKGWAL